MSIKNLLGLTLVCAILTNPLIRLSETEYGIFAIQSFLLPVSSFMSPIFGVDIIPLTGKEFLRIASECNILQIIVFLVIPFIFGSFFAWLVACVIITIVLWFFNYETQLFKVVSSIYHEARFRRKWLKYKNRRLR